MSIWALSSATSLASTLPAAPALLAAEAQGTPPAVAAGVGLTAFIILAAALLVTMQFDRHRWSDRERAAGDDEPTARHARTDAATPAAAQVGPRTPWEGQHAGRRGD